MILLTDTREQAPLDFKVGGAVSSIRVEGLPFGDYWAETEWGECMKVCFERKSLADLWGTLTNADNHARFKREIERAKAEDFSFLLVIEGTFTGVLEGFGRSEFKGESMAKMLFTMWVRYNVYPVFCQSRKEMAKFIVETFEAYGRENCKRTKKGLKT